MATRIPLSRKTLWLGLAGVLLPLAILLALQYGWLKELGQNSSLAQQAVLDNFLTGVATDIEQVYGKLGGKLESVRPHDLARLEQAFQKKEIPGVRHLFAVSYLDPEAPDFGKIRLYGQGCRRLEAPKDSAEMQAISLAVVPFKVEAMQKVPYTGDLRVEEGRPRHRILARPVLDGSSFVVGVVGMVLDESHFREQVLGPIVRERLAKLHGQSRDRPEVFVQDREGRPIYAIGQREGRAFDASRPLSGLVWKDWAIGLVCCLSPPEEWAASNFYINLWISALLSGTLVLGVLLALRAASREIRLSQMKGDFVSNVSHELRTPLASIRVFGELLRLGRVDSPEKAREYGEYIETESRRLSQLINNILDFGSIESGRKQYRFEPTDLTDLVEKTLRTFGVRLRQSGFTLRFEPPSQPLPELRLDGGAIAQSLSNLLDNAVKYSGDGREITVGLEGRDGTVALWVRDRGIGIPKDDQKKIFDRFHRVGTSLVHNVKGSGLGLAIVEHIASAHGGRVTVDSRPGEGSTFTLHLPLPPLPDGEKHAAERPAALGSPGTAGALRDRPA